MTQRNTGIAAETAAPTFSDLPKLPADQVVARSSIARNRSFHGRRVQTGAGQTIAALGLLAIITLAVIWALRHTPWYQEWHYARLSLPALQRLRGDRTDDPRLLYHIGRRLNQQERFGEADPLLRIAVGLEPEEPRLRDEWARALLGSGRITAAFGQLREFAGKNPGFAPAHLLLGKFYFTQHSLPRAVEELEKATAADANSATAWSYLAEARRGLNDLDGARRAAEKAVVLRPDASGPRLLLALILARAGHAPDAARREFERAVALGPQQAVIHREYARWLLDSGNAPNDVQLAEAEASRAVALSRDDADAYLVLGRGQMRNNKRDAAITALTRAAALAPYDPAPALALRQAYHQIGNAARARHWERAYLVRQKQATRYTTLFDAVRADPQAPGPRQRFARLLAERGDVNGCIRHHAAALRSALDAPAALIAAANDLSDTGHASDALPLATRAAQISRASPAAHEALGNALLGLGRAHEAALEYDKAVGFRPHRYADLRAKVERFWAERDRNPPPAEQAYRAALTLEHTQVGPRTLTPEGETLARKAVELEPTNLDYLRYLLRVQIGLRKTEAAVETANRLLSHFPKDAETHARLGVFLADRATRPDELAAAQEHLNQTKTSSSPAVAATRHYGLGLLALKRGQGALAARELRESARLDPDADVTFYKLALAERMAKNPTAAQQAMTVFRTRQNRKRAQMKVLGDIALHPDRPALYERAATLFVEQGLPEQAAAIRAEARRRFGSDKKQQTSLPPRKVSAR